MESIYTLSEKKRKLLCQRDPVAFEEFYRLSIDHFYRYMHHTYALPRATIDDILADVYVKIRNSLDRVYDSDGVVYWAWSICKNTVIDYFKKKKEYAFTDLSTSYDDGGVSDFDVEDDSVDLLGDIDVSYTYEMIRNAIITLPDAYREVLFLRFEEQLQYDEIALIVGVNSAVLRKRVSRGIQLLKAALPKI